jgi:hypothetical protein
MMTYEFDSKNSIIHLKASGVLVASDPINYFSRLDKDPSFKPNAEERIYFTDLDDIEFSYSDVINIRNAFEQYRHGEKISAGVFIVDSDLSFGMARMVISTFDPVFNKFTINKNG